MFQNRLEENGGALGFRDVTGVSFPANYSVGTGHYEQEMADLDSDLDLDIYGLNWLAGPGFTDATLENDGGGIFHMLPIAEHDPAFTRFFATPHEVDAEPVARAHGLDFVDATGDDVAGAVREAVAKGASAVVRIRSDRQTNHAMHAETRAAVVQSVIDALG